ncbi:MAG: hypothetical protein RLZZ631_651 [Cyanobacteriota bacterium]
MVTRLPGEAMESMASSSVNGDPAGVSDLGNTESSSETSTDALLEQLRADRLWLLQQLDGGRWPELRLDLAALERELGQLLEQAQEQLSGGNGRTS